MKSITTFIEQNGIEEFLEVIHNGSYRNNSTDFHAVIEDTCITEEDWFEFAWTLNDLVGSRGYDIFHIPNFNYLKVQRLSESYVSDNAPVPFGDICEYVSDKMDTNQSDIAAYLDFATIETNDKRTDSGEELVFDLSW